MTMSIPALLGRGIGFPMGVTADGRLRWSEGDRNVRESLRVLLLTDVGERLMRDYGTGLRPLLFEPNTPATRRVIQERITRAIARWEPRIRLEGVDVEDDAKDQKRVRATIRYQLVATGARESVGIDFEMER